MKYAFPLKPRTYNVLFITLDSCRYDTALKAKLNCLNKLAPLRQAETLATYTLPAHMSFFIGILPILRDGSADYLPGVNQVWRSKNARARKKSIAVNFDGETIIDYYIDNHYDVVGAGGVSFFNSSGKNILPKLFPKFLHFEKPKNIPSEANVPRSLDQFPLANIDLIISKLSKNNPFFLFINCPETHIPYDSPTTKVTSQYKNAIKKMYSVDFIKQRLLKPFEGLQKSERTLLLNAQKESLEWIDKQLKELIMNLPDNSLPTLIFVCADHGEEFGEGGRYGHAHNHESVTTVPLWCTILDNKSQHRL